VTCPGTGSVCFSATCDIALGCVVTTLQLCDDKSVCTIDICDDVEGCQYSPNTELLDNCTQQNDCAVPVCDPFIGCQYEPLNCNVTDSEDNCTIAGCDPDWDKPLDPDDEDAKYKCECDKPTGPCYEISTCGFPAGLIAGLAGGSIAAIVVCAAIVAFATCAGGTYAYANLNAAEDDVGMSQNPMYMNKGVSGTNPVHCD